MTVHQMIHAELSLGDLALSHAGASRVFQRHGLDFCCGGGATLAAACETKGLDAQSVLAELQAEQTDAEPAARWVEAPLAELIDHVLERFHAGHRAELPRLVAMAEKVEKVHADKASCPRGLTEHLQLVAESMEEHMQKEEQVLFPMLLSGRGRMAGMPIACMRDEHEDHGRNLLKLRELAHDFQPPEEACTTWRALYLGLEELEREVMEHVALENNVVFPRALRG